MASQSSHLNNAFFYYLPASLFLFVFVGISYIRTSMLSRSIYRKHSTPQSALPASERDNASKRTESARAESQMSSSVYAARCVIKTNVRNPILPGPQKYLTTHKAALAGVVREGFAFIPYLNEIHCSFSRPQGCFHGAWSSWHLQVVIVHLNRGYLCQIYSHFALFFLVGKRSERQKPAAARSALYSIFTGYASQYPSLHNSIP